MPELPEVQQTVDSLIPRVVGQVMSEIQMGKFDVVEPHGFDLRHALQGRRIVSVTRRAKRIVFLLDTGERFWVHLGMTGRLVVESMDVPLRPHTHFICNLSSAHQLRFSDPRRFGGIHWTGTTTGHEDDLGPEPLSICPIDFHTRLRATTRVIKTALLDQKLIAGLGNIYVDESLFDAKIHPLTPAIQISKKRATILCESIHRVLTAAINAGGSTLRDYVDADGKPGMFQLLHVVYDRAGQPCKACAAPIVRIIVHQRSTHFCKECQKL